MSLPKSKSHPSVLPTPVSSFIGREREIAEIAHLLADNRLVTLTGPGGCGKTRLALEVATECSGEFENGVWLTEFASLADPLLVPQVVASTLAVVERQKQALIDDLVNFLLNRQTLLVFDNCEHILEACAGLAETLLQNCPKLQILATSREPIAISGEMVWTVPPLSLPNIQPWSGVDKENKVRPAYLQSEAVQLFIARASMATADFKFTEENGAWIAEICRQLDGMPLAIELAAARVRAMSVRQIAERLDDRFHLLTGGSRTAPARQQTLAATLDWSYTLLAEVERTVLQRLSIFAGGATLEAAESICTGESVESKEVMDVLSRLVDKSLVVVDRPEGGEPRYHLLETIRHYASEKLAGTGETKKVRDRHLGYFIQWAENAEPKLRGVDQLIWLVQYEAEHDNLRTALEWSRENPIRAEDGLRLAAACGRFWRMHGHLSEGRARLTSVLSQPGVQKQSLVYAHALSLATNLAFLQSDFPGMRPLAEEALIIWRAAGQEGRAGSAFILDLIGELASEEGDFTRALDFFQEAIEIYIELNDLRGVSDIHMQFGWAMMRMGDYPQAERHLEEFKKLASEAGDKTSLTYAYSGLGEVALRQGQYQRAASMLGQGLELSRERGDRWGTGTLLGSLGWAALRQHDFKQMRKYLGESLSIRADIGDRGGIAWCLEKLAEAAALAGERQRAVIILGGATALRTPIGSKIDPADRPEYERSVAESRNAIGEKEFEAAWAEGKVMPLDKIIDYALSDLNLTKDEPSKSRKENYGGLTAREREVAALIAHGKSNREIAKVMVVGVRTVETYVTRILGKLGFDSRVQIATWAVEKGLGSSAEI